MMCGSKAKASPARRLQAATAATPAPAIHEQTTAAASASSAPAAAARRGAHADDKLHAVAEHRARELHNVFDDAFGDDFGDGSTDEDEDQPSRPISPAHAAESDALIASSLASSNPVLADAAKLLLKVTRLTSSPSPPPPAVGTMSPQAPSTPSPTPAWGDMQRQQARDMAMRTSPHHSPMATSPHHSPMRTSPPAAAPAPAHPANHPAAHHHHHHHRASPMPSATQTLLNAAMAMPAGQDSEAASILLRAASALPGAHPTERQQHPVTPQAQQHRQHPPQQQQAEHEPEPVARKPSPTAEQLRQMEAAASIHAPLKKRNLHKLRGHSPTTTPGAVNPSVDETNLIRGILQRSRRRASSSPKPAGAAGSSAAAGGSSSKKSFTKVTLQPWTSVELSEKAERALADLRSDWEDWVAPFTAAGQALRKRRRAEREGSGAARGKPAGGEQEQHGEGGDDEENPRKRHAKALGSMNKPQGFCHLSEPSMILSTTPPQQLLNALLGCRGYSSRPRPALPTALSRRTFADPSPLRVASHGPALLRVVRSGDPSALASLLHCGLHNNPSDAAGSSTLLQQVCATSDLTLFWVVTEAYGVDSFGPDSRGRTALHHLCAAQTDGDPSGPFWTAVYMILERDWRALRIADNDGKTPLDLAPEASWPAWNRYIHSVVEHYWSRSKDGECPSERRRKLAEEETLFERGVAERAENPPRDPKGAVPVDVARAVSSGAVRPDDVVRLRRKVEARAVAERGERKMPARTDTAARDQQAQAQAAAKRSRERASAPASPVAAAAAKAGSRAPAPAAAVLAAATAAQAAAAAASASGRIPRPPLVTAASAPVAAFAARRSDSLPTYQTGAAAARAHAAQAATAQQARRNASLPPTVMEVAARAAASLAAPPLSPQQAAVARVAAEGAARLAAPPLSPRQAAVARVAAEGAARLGAAAAAAAPGAKHPSPDGTPASKRVRTLQEPRTYAGRSA